jgi:glycosyltransferase involved in cell wall biosynthesis
LVQSLTSARRRKVIRGAKSILALNDEEARQLERCGVDRSARVLPYGLNFDEYANGSSHERSLSVLMLGDLHPRSGCVALLKALAELGPAGNGWEVVIAGRDDGRWRPMLEAAILRKGAQERVRFEFADDIEAQRRLLASASVLAAPSLTTEFPLSVLQAAASGVPVVATTCAAPPEMNGAISVCRPRRADLGEALRSVLTLSAEERRAMGEKLRAAGRSTLDWSMLAPRWAKMYCELT